MAPEADTFYLFPGKKVWVSGHAGMVDQALIRLLADENCEVLTVGRDLLDQRRQADVGAWMACPP